MPERDSNVFQDYPENIPILLQKNPRLFHKYSLKKLFGGKIGQSLISRSKLFKSIAAMLKGGWARSGQALSMEANYSYNIPKLKNSIPSNKPRKVLTSFADKISRVGWAE